jgi:hypothetical protein
VTDDFASRSQKSRFELLERATGPVTQGPDSHCLEPQITYTQKRLFATFLPCRWELAERIT